MRRAMLIQWMADVMIFAGLFLGFVNPLIWLLVPVGLLIAFGSAAYITYKVADKAIDKLEEKQ